MRRKRRQQETVLEQFWVEIGRFFWHAIRRLQMKKWTKPWSEPFYFHGNNFCYTPHIFKPKSNSENRCTAHSLHKAISSQTFNKYKKSENNWGPTTSEYTTVSYLKDKLSFRKTMETSALVAVEPRRPPMTDVGTETAFRLDQRKHFQKVNISSSQRSVDAIKPVYIFSCVDLLWSTCLASRISTQKEPLPRSEFTPASIWTYWMLIDRQMQSEIMPELHRFFRSWPPGPHLQILNQEIFWSPW